MIDRRGILLIVGAALLVGCGDNGALCVDPELLGPGERQMRATQAYIDTSGDPAQTCAGCQFFGGADSTGCGHCEILAGTVGAGGWCNAWAAKS